MFRNTAEATDFIQQHGLNISDGLVKPPTYPHPHTDTPSSSGLDNNNGPWPVKSNVGTVKLATQCPDRAAAKH